MLQPGDAYIIRSGGGGGYGSPLERDLDTLERDVRCGYVTKEAAEKYYGAVFQPDSLALDMAATKARRASMAQQGLPHDEPITEIIIPFPTAAQPQAREHRAREADRRGARGVRDAVPLLQLKRGPDRDRRTCRPDAGRYRIKAGVIDAVLRNDDEYVRPRQ